MTRRLAVAALALLMAAGVLPAGALPEPGTTGAPFVDVYTGRTDDRLVYDVTVIASDPDGPVSSITVCAAGTCQEQTYPEAGTLERADTCIFGDVEVHDFQVSFPVPGTYDVTATVMAAGCPVVGPESQTTETTTTVTVSPPPPPIPCARTGTPTATDTGVTAERVLLASTAAFLQDSPAAHAAIHGVGAAVRRINDSGGVCNRRVEVVWSDDAYDATYGHANIQRWIAEGAFAFVAMPSGPGLEAALQDGTIAAAGIPVVGTTGQSAAEFASPLDWVAGTSNADFGAVAARHAYESGARTFVVAWQDRFGGKALRDAVEAAVTALTGSGLTAEVHAPDYATAFDAEMHGVAERCGGRMCDAVILALDNQAAMLWGQAAERYDLQAQVETSIWPWSMNATVGRDCRGCNGYLGWSGFDVPIGEASAAAQAYLDAVREYSPVMDAVDPYTEAAYAGTMLMAHAMGAVGVNLKRSTLKRVLNRATFDLGLTAAPLSWRQTRNPNRSLRAYEFVYGASFAGWRAATGWIQAIP